MVSRRSKFDLAEDGGIANPIPVEVVSRGDVNDIKVSTLAPNPTVKLIGPGRAADRRSRREQGRRAVRRAASSRAARSTGVGAAHARRSAARTAIILKAPRMRLKPRAPRAGIRVSARDPCRVQGRRRTVHRQRHQAHSGMTTSRA